MKWIFIEKQPDEPNQRSLCINLEQLLYVEEVITGIRFYFRDGSAATSTSDIETIRALIREELIG